MAPASRPGKTTQASGSHSPPLPATARQASAPTSRSSPQITAGGASPARAEARAIRGTSAGKQVAPNTPASTSAGVPVTPVQSTITSTAEIASETTRIGIHQIVTAMKHDSTATMASAARTRTERSAADAGAGGRRAAGDTSPGKQAVHTAAAAAWAVIEPRSPRHAITFGRAQTWVPA